MLGVVRRSGKVGEVGGGRVGGNLRWMSKKASRSVGEGFSYLRIDFPSSNALECLDSDGFRMYKERCHSWW